MLLRNITCICGASDERACPFSERSFLDPGEKKDVDFFIDQEEFSYYGKNMETVSSGMKLRISIGNSSDHLVSENIIQA